MSMDDPDRGVKSVFCNQCGNWPGWTGGDYPERGPNGHIALRLSHEDWFNEVYLDGVKQKRCLEAVPGPYGAVLNTTREEPGAVDLCSSCFGGFMLAEIRGDVRVEHVDISDPAVARAIHESHQCQKCREAAEPEEADPVPDE